MIVNIEPFRYVLRSTITGNFYHVMQNKLVECNTIALQKYLSSDIIVIQNKFKQQFDDEKIEVYELKYQLSSLSHKKKLIDYTSTEKMLRCLVYAYKTKDLKHKNHPVKLGHEYLDHMMSRAIELLMNLDVELVELNHDDFEDLS